MRYLSLFSGIEAASAAWGSLGWECAAVAEVEPFPCSVLEHHHPSVPNLGDVTRVTEARIKALGHIDVVVFGSPCQDLSVAGQRKGLINEHGDITRSGLFFTAINIFHWSGARFALWENVPGAFSSGKGRDFASVVSFMAGLDDVDVPPNGWGTEGAALGDNGLLEWGTLDAQWFGVAQRRRRVFAILDTGDWAGRPPILLEPESLRGNSAPRREAGENVAPTISARPTGGGGLGTDFDCDGGVIAQPFTVANTLTQRMGKGINSTVDEGQTPVVSIAHAETMPTMQTGSGNPSGHGARSGDTKDAYIVPVAYSIITANTGANGLGVTQELSATLDQAQPHAVAFVQNTRDEVRLMNGDGNIVGALAAEAGMKQQCYVAYGFTTEQTPKFRADQAFTLTKQSPSGGGQPQCVAYAIFGGNPRKDRPEGGFYVRRQEVSKALDAAGGLNPACSQGGMAVAFNWNAQASQLPSDGGRGTEVNDGLTCSQQAAVATSMQVRRLTPTECERLQGFPDGHTAITYRNKPAADGPRYKALGNSMAVPVMRHLGIKIMEAVWHI